MTDFRMFQVSDTHLSRVHPYFTDNFMCVAAHVRREKPDLVLNSGDIAIDGPGRPDDLVYARDCHAEIAAELLAIPGNHDIGDNPPDGDAKPKQDVTDARLGHYRGLFGADHWCRDVGNWRLVGINSLLFNTGRDDEAAQWASIEAALDGAGDRPVAIFLHKPPVKERADEINEAPGRYLPTTSRQRLLSLMATARVKLLSCGHVHQSRRIEVAGASHVWCPSSAFVLPDSFQPVIGTKQVGMIDYRFSGDEVEVGFVTPEGMRNLDIHDFPQVYGALG
ncbi:MAG: metallophosphoesterase [Pseudomonadota bacterium]|nr:metallophosphoesterase [Pseudomonadota bacterium]